MSAAPAAAGRRRRVRWCLAAVVVAGCGLRVWIASAQLDNTRHHDERFSLHNVAALLDEGTLRPANAYYPSLSWLPQALVMGASERLSRATGVEALSIHSERTADGWSPTAYLLARLVSVAWGTLGILAVYAIGRRLFEPRAGLAAAALVAALPPHVVTSGLFKPDILVSLLVAVTFLWSLDAAERPTAGRFARAGLGVGLAVAAKYTGVGAAFPVAVAALAGGGRGAEAGKAPALVQRLALLALAGVASLAVFFALNPYTAEIFAYLPRLWGIMESKGAASGDSHLDVLVRAALYPVRHHGWPVALLALAGLVALGARLARRSAPFARRREAAMVLAYALGYPLLYAASTRLFRGQNLLPITTFTALAAGWAAVGLWDRAAIRLPRPVRRGLAAPLVALAVLALFGHAGRGVYLGTVPTTWELAERWLASRLDPPAPRRLYFEKRGERLSVRRAGHQVPTFGVERLTEVPAEALDRADAVLFPSSDLEGDEGAFYLRLTAARGGGGHRFEPRWLHAHGPGLVALVHGWEPAGEPEPLALEPRGGNRFGAVLAAPTIEGEVVSLTLRVPWRRRGPKCHWLTIDGERYRLIVTRVADRYGHYQTEKLVLPPGSDTLRLGLERGLDLRRGVEAELWRWRRAGE